MKLKLILIFFLWFYSLNSFAVIGAWWFIGSFDDSSIELADAQSEAHRSVVDSFPQCGGGSWIVGATDANGPTDYFYRSSEETCTFDPLTNITFVERKDCPADDIAQLESGSESGYGQGDFICAPNCEWPETYNPATSQCEFYDDCPTGEVPHPTNPFVCIPSDCNAGNVTNVWYGTYWANSVSDVNVSIPSTICVGSCEANTSGGELQVVHQGGSCGTINGQQVCGEPTGYGIAVSATETGNECQGDTQQPACPTCTTQPLGAPDPIGGESEEPPQPEDPPSGPKTTTQDTTDNGDGTETTTTTTTYLDGSTTTTTTTTNTTTGASSTSVVTSPGQSEDEDGPEEERTYGGGGCGAQPLCNGDPIDCAIASHIWETKCALDSEGVTVNESEIETAVGSSDLETILDGGEIDASDPLSLGGYTEISAPACPAGVTVTTMGVAHTSDWSFMCDFLLQARPITHAVGLFLSLMIFYRGIVREG